jgi:hypothetical protein
VFGIISSYQHNSSHIRSVWNNFFMATQFIAQAKINLYSFGVLQNSFPKRDMEVGLTCKKK